MGMKYLWDTNTAIYFLQRQFPLSAEQFIDSILQENPPALSAITEIELMCWKTAGDDDLKVLANFIEDSVIFELEKDIKIKTVALRKSYKIKLPDAIIAATAIVYNLTLLTRNVSDFSRIENLTLINPWEAH